MEIRESIKQIEQHSPDFKMKKFNNYNNGIKYAERSVLESFDLDQSIKVPPPKHLVSYFKLNLLFYSKPKMMNCILKVCMDPVVEFQFTHQSKRKRTA